MTCFPLFRSSFYSMLMLGLHAHMLDIMSMARLCSDLCVRMLFAMFYAQIHILTYLYAWIHVLPRLCASFHMPTHMLPFLGLDLCLCAQIYVFICWCARIYALLALFHLPCACVLHVMFVCTFYAPMPISESTHACMLGFMSFHVYVLNFYMFTCIFLCLYVQIYVLTQIGRAHV